MRWVSFELVGEVFERNVVKLGIKGFNSLKTISRFNEREFDFGSEDKKGLADIWSREKLDESECRRDRRRKDI